MSQNNGFMKALKCRECAREYPLGATHVCEFDFGPLEVAYDYDRIRQGLTRERITSPDSVSIRKTGAEESADSVGKVSGST